MTTIETTDPAWLTVGAKVAVLTDGRSVEFRTVRRITIAFVWLSDGQRVNRSSLTRQTPGLPTDLFSTEVLHPDDPRVLRILAGATR